MTVIVNSLVPETLEKINAFTVTGGRVLTGVESARALIDAQLRGIEAAGQALDAVIKINTVLVPGVTTGKSLPSRKDAPHSARRS